MLRTEVLKHKSSLHILLKSQFKSQFWQNKMQLDTGMQICASTHHRSIHTWKVGIWFSTALVKSHTNAEATGHSIVLLGEAPLRSYTTARKFTWGFFFHTIYDLQPLFFLNFGLICTREVNPLKEMFNNDFLQDWFRCLVRMGLNCFQHCSRNIRHHDSHTYIHIH